MPSENWRVELFRFALKSNKVNKSKLKFFLWHGDKSLTETDKDVLRLLNIEPSTQSRDYVRNKKQFQLHGLLTEQRHPKTWNLSSTIKYDVKRGLKQILSVDRDIVQSFKRLAQDMSVLNQASQAVTQALERRQKIFIYGCGSTGRLAKHMESALWKPFWKKVRKSAQWERLKRNLPEDIGDRLIGEMTGGDRALISALEGFEDLELVGELQLKDRGVEKGDCVFAITEGGETSSVIGAIKAAQAQYGELTQETAEEAAGHLCFIYNNPDEVLMPLERSRSVIANPAITKINLTTGPQAITGSTRMQATTSETFVLGAILEDGISRFLQKYLSDEEMTKLGFSRNSNIKKRLLCFDELRKLLMSQLPDMAKFTALESGVYGYNRHATYFAKKALITVFIDCAERSPTFHLDPLDTTEDKTRKCWLQVWTEAENGQQAWHNFLGRPFRGLAKDAFKPCFLNQIADIYLREAALRSLSLAGEDQASLYDFSFSPENMGARGPQKGDLGVLVCVDEEIEELDHPDSPFFQFVELFKANEAHITLILAGDMGNRNLNTILSRLPIEKNNDIVISLDMAGTDDPLGIKRQTILKVLLNAHSTGVMASLGRVIGNTMTSVIPSNLKLIGRATYLIMNHVNDVLFQNEWIRKCGKREPITYAAVNAVLFSAIGFVAEGNAQAGEVELSIIRILESLRTTKAISWDEAHSIAKSYGLEYYLGSLNPASNHSIDPQRHK